MNEIITITVKKHTKNPDNAHQVLFYLGGFQGACLPYTLCLVFFIVFFEIDHCSYSSSFVLDSISHDYMHVDENCLSYYKHKNCKAVF